MQLTVVLADFFPDAAALAAAGERLAPLPGLEALLRYGRQTRSDDDWRGWLAHSLGRAELANVPPAQVAACALPDAPAGALFATPVHLLAGIDHLRLHPAGLLRLEQAEGAQVAECFATVFGASGWRLLPLAGSFVLQGLAQPADSGAREKTAARDPARWLGANVAAAFAGTAPALRSAAAEFEMWLHEQAFNRQRVARGALPLNSLWLWGGGAATTVAARELPARPATQLQGHDPFVAGLCAACGLPAPGAATRLEQLEFTAGSHALAVVSAAACDPRDAPLARIERDWLVPALAALRERRLARLQVHVGTRVLTLQPGSLRRFWRRARPWWQRL
jgi:hypothetical protein